MCWRVSTIIAKCLCEYVPSPLEYLNTHAPFWLCFLTPISQLLEYYYIKCHKSNWNKFFSICFFYVVGFEFSVPANCEIVKKKPGVKIKFVQKCQGKEIQTTKTTNTLSYYTQREIIIIKTTKVTSKNCLFVCSLFGLALSLSRSMLCLFFFGEKSSRVVFSQPLSN